MTMTEGCIFMRPGKEAGFQFFNRMICIWMSFFPTQILTQKIPGDAESPLQL